MRIEILDEAQEDLIQGFQFYESREAGLGSYFLDCLFSDIDSLLLYAGIHQVAYAYHRCLSKRFPFAIYYTVGLSQESVLDQGTIEGVWLTKPLGPAPGEGPAHRHIVGDSLRVHRASHAARLQLTPQ